MRPSPSPEGRKIFNPEKPDQNKNEINPELESSLSKHIFDTNP